MNVDRASDDLAGAAARIRSDAALLDVVGDRAAADEWLALPGW